MTAVIDKPTVLCRCCGNPVEKLDWQQAIVPGKPGYWMITCLTPACDLYYHTFSSRSYDTMNLADYCKSALK